MHKRGQVSFGDDNTATLIRASVWIEQEIAIAAFIKHTTKKQLHIASYIENGVDREGIRDLLHLNPVWFTNNDEVLEEFKRKLAAWEPSQAEPNFEDEFGKLELIHQAGYGGIAGNVIHLTATLTNLTSRANEYACTLEVPAALLSFSGNTTYVVEVGSRSGYRRFRTTEAHKGMPLVKGETMDMLNLDISMSGLPPDLRSKVLEQAICVTAEMGSYSYKREIPCSRIFPLT